MSTPLEKDDQAASSYRGGSLTGSSESELKRLREHIDEADRELLRTLAERLEFVVQIGKLKRQEGLEVRDEKRRSDVISSRIYNGRNLGISEELVRKLFEAILDHAETLEKK